MSVEQETHFVGKIAQKAILEHNGKVLLTRDSRDTNTWELPGGRLNIGETPQAGLERELYEELGVYCEIKEVVYVGQFVHTVNGASVLALVYRATFSGASEDFKVDPIEVEEMAWVDSTNWTRFPLFPEYERALATYFNSL